MDSTRKNTFLWGLAAGVASYHLLKNTKLSVDILGGENFGLAIPNNNNPQLPMPTPPTPPTPPNYITLGLVALAAYFILK